MTCFTCWPVIQQAYKNSDLVWVQCTTHLSRLNHTIRQTHEAVPGYGFFSVSRQLVGCLDLQIQAQFIPFRVQEIVSQLLCVVCLLWFSLYLLLSFHNCLTVLQPDLLKFPLIVSYSYSVVLVNQSYLITLGRRPIIISNILGNFHPSPLSTAVKLSAISLLKLCQNCFAGFYAKHRIMEIKKSTNKNDDARL